MHGLLTFGGLVCPTHYTFAVVRPTCGTSHKFS